MADDKKTQTQKINQNGRPVLVVSNEDIKSAASAAENTADWLGYLTTGAKVVDKNNFFWGLFHSTSTPPFSMERLKEIAKFKMYRYNYETNHVFQGNQHRQVSSVKKVIEKVDNAGGLLSIGSDLGELAIAAREKDAEAFAKKTSSMVISKGVDTAGVAIAGKCTRFATSRVDPKRMAIAGAACYAAWYYGTSNVGDWAGDQVGETDTARKTAAAVIDAIDVVDQQEQAAEEKRKQQEAKKEPMSIWHLKSSD